MFIRRTAAVLLVDAEMAIRSGSWIVSRTHNPLPAMASLELMLASPASDDTVSDAVDVLYAVMGEAMMAGEAMIPGYEQFEIGDIHPELLIDTPAEAPIAANDASTPLRRAA